MKLAIVGYGRMGRAIEEVAGGRDHEIVVRLGSADNPEGRGLTEERLAGAEVALDFTEPQAVSANIEAAAGAGVDLVVGTTGWYEELDRVHDVIDAAGTGLIYAPNFSITTQVLFRLARLAARFGDRLEDSDMYVLEIHHRHKRDHPSGTARRLAGILLEELGGKTRWEATPGPGVMGAEVLQVAAVRAGENPGAHHVVLEGPDDRIEIQHESRGRRGFARGAVAAAEWIRGRTGIYTMEDMMHEMFGTFGPEVG